MLLFQVITNIFLLVVLLNVMSCIGGNWKHIVNPNVNDYERLPREQGIASGTWDGSKDLESGLEGKKILLFEDFEATNYKEKWPVYWNRPVGEGTVSSPLKYVFAGKNLLTYKAIKVNMVHLVREKLY